MRNFKKTLSFLLSTVIIVSSVVGVGTTVFAATDERTYKNFKYRILDDNTAEICGYTGKDAVVTVPDSIDSKPVTSIGRTAFYSGKIKEVTIPDTVKNIKWWAFYGCESLEKINLNFGLKTVGYGAFMNCKNLKSVSIPMSVTKICDDSFAVSCSTKKGVFDTYSKQTISTQQYSTDSLFTLEGYSGTVAEKYCNDNSLNFLSLGNVIYGDVNNNGTVEVADAKLAKSLIDTVPTEEELTAPMLTMTAKSQKMMLILFCRLSATNFTHSFFRVQRLCILLPTTFRAELCIVTATALPTVRVRTQWEIQHILSAIMLPKNII